LNSCAKQAPRKSISSAPARQSNTPCYYGIDFPLQSELLADGRDLAAIERELGADAVIYQDLEGLRRSIVDSAACAARGAGAKAVGTCNEGFKPCMACLDGEYPTDVTAGARFAETRQLDRKGK
jgi:amidophosphoribosyltransferase